MSVTGWASCVAGFTGGRVDLACPEHSTAEHRYTGGAVGGLGLVFACGCIGSYHFPFACESDARPRRGEPS